MTKEKLKSYIYCKHRLDAGKASESDILTVKEVEQFIEGIDDMHIIERNVLTLRYLKGYSWNDTALGTHNTAESCRKIAERFLKNLSVF